MTSHIKNGIAALKNGEKIKARSLLSIAVRDNPEDEKAWLALAAASEKREQRIYCLKRVLSLNPENIIAKREFSKLVSPSSAHSQNKHRQKVGKENLLSKLTKTRVAIFGRSVSLMVIFVVVLISGLIIFCGTAVATFVPKATPLPTVSVKTSLISTPKPIQVSEPTEQNTETQNPTPKPTEKTSTHTSEITSTKIPYTPTPFQPPQGFIESGVWECPSSIEGAAYVGSKKSDKFHYLSCRWADEIKPQNRICFIDRTSALDYGYVPCEVCEP